MPSTSMMKDIESDLESSNEQRLDEATPQRRRRTWGEVRVFGRWCKGCGLCIAFCPAGVFEAGDDGYPRVRFPDLCTGCEWCEFHCPDMAIDVIRHQHPTRSNGS